MARFKDVEQDQGYFLTIYPENHFSENSIEKTIDRFIEEEVDIKIFEHHYKNDAIGQKAIHPKIKLKVIIYSFVNGIQSLRIMENMMRMNHVGYLFLTGNRVIDHSTLCKFINDFPGEIKWVFSRLLYLMHRMGMVDWSKVVIDGTKISSNASKEMTSNAGGFKKKMKRIEKLTEKILQRAKQLEEQEEEGKIDSSAIDAERKRIERQKNQYDRTVRKMKEYEKEVEEEKIDPDKKINLTDPESKLLNDKEKYIQGYNVQAAYSNNDVLIDIEAVDSATDMNLTDKMIRQVDEVKKQNNVNCESAYLNDKGYFNPEQVANLIKDGFDLYVAPNEYFYKSWVFTQEHQVELDGDDIIFICANGKRKKGRYYSEKNQYRFEMSRKDCVGCDKKITCWKNLKETNNSKKFTAAKSYVDDQKLWENYREKIESEQGKIIYNRRIGKEHNFRDLKALNGLRTIERRGRMKCNTIALLAGIAHNLKKYCKYMIDPEGNELKLQNQT